MTLEKAEEFKQGDYYIADGVIYKFHELIISEKHVDWAWLYGFNADEELRTHDVDDCFTLGSYCGSFDKSVLPPKSSNEDRSIVVIIKDEYGYIISGIYNYNTSEWRFFKDRASNYKPPDNLRFTYMFKPDYL